MNSNSREADLAEKLQTSPTICLNFRAWGYPPPIFLICSSHPLDEPTSRDAIGKWDGSTSLYSVLHFYLAKPGPPSREILLLVSSAYTVPKQARRLCHQRPSPISGWRMFYCRNVGGRGGSACQDRRERDAGNLRLGGLDAHHSELDLREKTGNRNQRVWEIVRVGRNSRSNSLAAYYRLRNNQRIWGDQQICVFEASSRSWSLPRLQDRCRRQRRLKPSPGGKVPADAIPAGGLADRLR